MSLTKIVAITVGVLVLLGLGFSMVMASQGKPTIWGLIGAPKIANTDKLMGAADEANYPWKVYTNDKTLGLLPCGDLTPDQPGDEELGEWCSSKGEAKLTRTNDSSVLNFNGTAFHYSCKPGSSLPGALMECSLDPWGSLF